MVNITNVTEEIKIPETYEEIFKEIFEKQLNLLIKYKNIERFAGNPMSTYLTETGKLVSINTLETQEICKNFAWRIMEEIGESIDAVKINDRTHAGEEISDGLHFITELMLLNGFTSDKLNIQKIKENETSIMNNYDTPLDSLYELVYTLGMTMNKLKMKPWKQSQTLTDEKRYYEMLEQTYYKYLNLCFSMGFNMEEIYLLYFKKNKVNNFRIDTKY